MMRRLQSFDFRKSRYERPNQTWLCGRAAEGCPCRVGPDRRGRCRARAACQPRQDGARFVCTRAQDAGGACREGPRPDGACAHPIPPCTPVRSLRAKRALAARWAAAVAIGLLAIVLAGPHGARWLSPGPLSASHASVEDCASCHEEAGDDTIGWIHAAIGAVPPAGEGDSKLCLSCHTPGAAPMQPHGVPPARLAAATPDTTEAGIQPVSLALSDKLFGAPGQSRPGDDGGLACATCHAEHAGVDADVTAMSDRQCQACHTRKFAAFTEGHPAFGDYPYTRRTRINFDHASHFRKHFPESDADAPNQCADCHQTGVRGAQMRTAGFETACASCHAGEIRGESAAGSTGIPIVTVPGLDLEALRAHNAGIGTWPELSDRALTPFMRAIFAGDPELRAALETYRTLDPLDLREASDAQIDAVARIAWAVKALLYDLVDQGPAALRTRLETGLGIELSGAHLRAMTGGLPLAAVRETAREWFPELAGEIQRHRAGKPVPMPASEFEAAATPEADTDSGSEGAQTDILGGDAAAGGDTGSQDDILGGDEPDGGDLLGGGADAGGQEDILGGDTPEGGDLMSAGTDAANQGDILGGDEPAGGDLLGGGSEDSDGGLLGGDEPAGGNLLGGDAETAEAESAATAPVEASLPEPNPESWSALGGWYRDYFALRYRPGDHADPVLKTWIDVGGQALADDSHGRAAGQAIVDTLTADGAPGQCAGCHSLDRQDDGGLVANWHGFRPRPAVQGFTRFAHAPHFARIGDDTGCATCHTLNREADYLAGFEDRDPTRFQSNFQPIGRETCAACHVEEAAGNACTQCHNYHVGEIDPKSMATGLEAMATTQ